MKISLEIEIEITFKNINLYHIIILTESGIL